MLPKCNMIPPFCISIGDKLKNLKSIMENTRKNEIKISFQITSSLFGAAASVRKAFLPERSIQLVTNAEPSIIKIISRNGGLNPSEVLSLANRKNGVAPNIFSSNLKNSSQKNKFFELEGTNIWIWVVITQYKFSMVKVEDCLNVSWLSDLRGHIVDSTWKLAERDGGTHFDIIFEKKFSCLCRKVIGIKHQQSIFMPFGFHDVHPFLNNCVYRCLLPQLLVG